MSVASLGTAIKTVFVILRKKIISKRKMSKLVNPFLVRILIFKFIISIPSNGAKNLLRPNDIYKFMTLLPQDYYLIPGNNAKNLLRPFFICLKRWNCSLLKDDSFKICVCGLNHYKCTGRTSNKSGYFK